MKHIQKFETLQKNSYHVHDMVVSISKDMGHGKGEIIKYEPENNQALIRQSNGLKSIVSLDQIKLQTEPTTENENTELQSY